jgi:F1F0 ATPase subunit 2
MDASAMTDLHASLTSILAMPMSWIGGAALAFIAGILLGLGHFASLWWNCDAFAKGRIGRAFAIQLARLVSVVVGFALVARFGAVPLLAAGSGLLLARALVRRRVEAMIPVTAATKEVKR